VIKEAQVVVHEGHQPDLLADLLDADVLAGEHRAEIDPSLATTPNSMKVMRFPE
jgi:hypothetical protein